MNPAIVKANQMLIMNLDSNELAFVAKNNPMNEMHELLINTITVSIILSVSFAVVPNSDIILLNLVFEIFVINVITIHSKRKIATNKDKIKLAFII